MKKNDGYQVLCNWVQSRKANEHPHGSSNVEFPKGRVYREAAILSVRRNADFAYFRDYGVSISGTKYKAIPYGPVPNMYETIFENMAETDVIDIFFESKENGSKKEKLVGRSDRPFNPSLFSTEELHYLKKVANQFSKTPPNEIVEISHNELAWIENEQHKNFISYEYALDLKAV